MLSLRYGRLPVLFTAFAAQLLALGLLNAAQTPLTYLAAVSIWGFSWNLGIAYLVAGFAVLLSLCALLGSLRHPFSASAIDP